MEIIMASCSPELKNAILSQVAVLQRQYPHKAETELYMDAVAELYESQTGVFDPAHPADEFAIILAMIQRETDISEIEEKGKKLQEIEVFQKGWEEGIAPESPIMPNKEENQPGQTRADESLVELLETCLK